MKSISKNCYLLFLFCILQGCATGGARLGLTELPDHLGEYGLLVAELGPDTWWEDAEAIFSKGADKAYQGFIVRKLKPGKYTLETIRGIAGYTTNVLGPVKQIKTIEVNREFEIKAGKVTSLGLIYILIEETNHASVFTFENKDSVMAHLTDYYPALATTIDRDSVIFPPFKYDNTRLDSVRQYVATVSMKPNKTTAGVLGHKAINKASSNFWIGDLGSLIYIGGEKSKRDIRFLETNTVSELSQLTGSRPLFLSGDGRLITVKDGKASFSPQVPEGFIARRGAVMGEEGIVLIDRSFNVASSIDGKNWSVFKENNIQEEDLLFGGFGTGPTGIFAFARSRKVFVGMARAVYIDAGTGKISTLELPDGAGNKVFQILGTEAGTYVADYYNSPTHLYFKAKDSDEWVENQLDFGSCYFTTPDFSGKTIAATCSNAKIHVKLISRDYGVTWNETN